MTQPISVKQDEIFDVNQQQRKASHPAHSVWVSASAGSGKTKVLSDRIIRLLLSGVPPQKILCLTFTKAAAAEMSIRLTQRLSKWAICADEELEKELDNLQGHAIQVGQRERARRLFAETLSCPGGMRVQTIHSFAQEILGRFPLEAGLPPHFTVLEESESRTLRQEGMHDFLQELASGNDPELAQALKTLVGSLGEERFTFQLNEVMRQREKWDELLAKEGSFETVCARIAEKLGLDPSDSEENLIAKACREESFDRAQLLSLGKTLVEKGAATAKKSGQFILTWLALNEEERFSCLPNYKQAFLTQKNTVSRNLVRYKPLKDDEALLPVFNTEAERLQEVFLKLETLQTYQEGVALMKLGQRVMTDYAARKKARAGLDYDDLILRTRALLRRPDIAPWVLFKLDGGVSHILLDEAQDTNPAQWDIVQALSDEFFAGQGAERDQERTLFVVGDEKQSIYSFLKADPAEFERRRVYFKNKIETSGARFEETPLHVSFRSAPAVLRAVDKVFAEPKNQQGVSHADIKHHAFRDKASGRVEVWPLCKANKTTDPRTVTEWQLPRAYETLADPAIKLADDLACKVKEWIANGEAIYDSDLKILRPMQARDVMLLVRNRKGIADHLVRAFKHHRVPISGVDKMLLSTQLPVMDLSALLQFTLLPQDDLNLACVLRGPLFGACEEELEQVAIGREGTLWNSLLKHAKDNERVASWRDYLEHIAKLADQCNPLALLIQILTQACPQDNISGRRALISRLGPQAEDPIDELLNQAENFVTQKNTSLQAFLYELSAGDAEIKRELEQHMDCVRITTVHGAKGLEAPVVILPDTVGVPRVSDLPKILWDEVSGLPFYAPRNPSNEYVSDLFDKARMGQLEEYRRLLYVALTRAADRLIVCGYEPEKKIAFEESWYSLVQTALAPPRPENDEDDLEKEREPIVVADYVQEEIIVQTPPELTADAEPLPEWLRQPPPPEPTPPRPLVPSRPSQAEQESEAPFAAPQDVRFARGRLIHKLLQNLPEVPEEKRDDVAKRFLSNPQHGLDEVQQDEIIHEVLALLAHPDFAPLFGAQSRAEIPVIGLSGERLISGQVDRLALVGDEVWIVDYKTNRPPPQDVAGVSDVYHRQMAAYRTVLAAIYPQKTIKCFLLWTYELRLMEIE